MAKKPKLQQSTLTASLERDAFEKARRALMRRDPILAPIIKKHRERSLVDAPAVDPFSALVRTITAQQISTKAAATIHGRLVALMPGGIATPDALLALTDDQMRVAGLSRQKTSYLRDLAAKVLAAELPIHSLHEMADEEVIDAIVKVKGLGRWSAEMFLMFRLRRPDVLPVDDLGIRKGVQAVDKLEAMPPPKWLIERGEKWGPYRTYASLYLWRIADLANAPKTKDAKPVKRSQG